MYLDKFYTSKDIAKKCVDLLHTFLTVSATDKFLEPTAGNGAFLDYITNYEAYDLKPEDDRIKQQDIFTFVPNRTDYITIGNPPFGRRSKLAIDVFNTVSKYSNVVSFVVPISFLKYSIQKQLDNDFKLIHNWELPKHSFLVKNKPYNVNCVFQIWVRKDCKYDIHPDIRLTRKPSMRCDDFKIWQYNATDSQFKNVEQDWDIAVYRQGYKDYTKKFTQEDKDQVIAEMNGSSTGTKIQFFFIKPMTDDAKRIINNIDFVKLAHKNTSIPGFGKADFVEYYLRLKQELSS